MQEALRLTRPGRSDSKTIPLIAVAANAYENDIQNRLRAGMNAHWAKPVHMGQLYQALSEFLTAGAGQAKE